VLRNSRPAKNAMLDVFLRTNRERIIAETRKKVALRPAPRATEAELLHGVPLFLEQLVATLENVGSSTAAMSASALLHGDEMRLKGFTLAQVVHDYGDICQAVTELAIEQDAPITTEEFRTLNRCLDDAIAHAVTGYAHRRDLVIADEHTQRLGRLAHELRNRVQTATLAFDILRRGSVGVGGSTAAALGRSLDGLREIIDRSLAEVRLEAGIDRRQRFSLADFIEEVEICAVIDANSRGIHLTVPPVDQNIEIEADRQILSSVITNLVQNALKFTRPEGDVSLTTHATADRVFIDVEDECGGLPTGKAEALFAPFEQRSENRTGLGLGLAICRKGAEANGGTIHTRNKPGHGCVFSVELPRAVSKG
jgi:signal transduction histidine kinase